MHNLCHMLIAWAILLCSRRERATVLTYSVKCSAYRYIMILCYALLSDTCAEHGACSMKCSALECMLCFTQQAEDWSALKKHITVRAAFLSEERYVV